MRNTPVIIFVNKMDREGKDAFSLLDELEEKLDIKVRPLTWPIGMGDRFKGVYNIYNKNLNLFSASKTKKADDVVSISELSDPLIDELVGEQFAGELREELDIIDGVYDAFDREKYLSGEVAPVFFGSAVNNFGVHSNLKRYHLRGNRCDDIHLQYHFHYLDKRIKGAKCNYEFLQLDTY